MKDKLESELTPRISQAVQGVSSSAPQGTCRPAEVPPLHAKLRPAAVAVRTPVLIHAEAAGCPGELLLPEPS